MRSANGTGFLILSDADQLPSARVLEGALGLQDACEAWFGGPNAYEVAQFAFQERCAGSAVKAIAAFGEACLPALALAIQLPVDRLGLLFPRMSARRDRRLSRFVRRNLSLCSADTLFVGDSLAGLLFRATRWMPHGSHLWLDAEAREENVPWTKCEFSVKNAICSFLQMGVHSKLLAENPEMCIIYR